LNKASNSDRLEVPVGAYMMSSVPSDAAMAKPEGMRERLVTSTVSGMRIVVRRRDVPMLWWIV
jgi:hypothetical protein